MSDAGPRYLSSPITTGPRLPFSEAVRVGELLFVSGQLGNRPGTLELVPGGIAAEARQTMENVRATLERHGASLANVVKCTVFLADMAEWRSFNAVYLEFFAPDRLPARSALGASGLALGARVELECVAWSPAPPAAEAEGGGAPPSGSRTPRQPFA